MVKAMGRGRRTPFSELDAAASQAGEPVEVAGWISPFDAAPRAGYFALVEDAACCAGCLPRDAERRIEVFAAEPLPVTGRRVRLAGRLRRLVDDAAGWRFQLREARLLEEGGDSDSADGAFNRRQVLKAATLACLAAASLEAVAAPDAEVSEAAARDALQGMATIDIHSHDGRLIGYRRVESDAAGFSPVLAPMRDGGMAVLCLAMVADSPATHVTADHRIQAYREPLPGELVAYGQRAFRRLHQLVQAQGLDLVKDADALARARSERPAVIVSAEGGDFLEGQADRVDEAHAQWSLRHLQLTHYRVNELGDIQTEAPVHGGLSAAGAEVVRRCNRLGVVVDVAHATFEMVKQVVAVTTKPLVLSHTSLAAHPGPRSRLISVEHARLVSGTGGVIGIWPPASIFPDMPALAAGIARMVDAVGVDHVALGTDMRGLVGRSTFDSYQDLPRLTSALLQRGFQRDEVRKILGGNYLRVFTASLAAA
jgi:membrane dipeptidase